ncbi:DNA-directed RNA polymerase, partial [Tulasnella sp. 427]
YIERASKVFDGMRFDLLNPLPDSIMSVDLHNKMVDAYFAQAERDIGQSTRWMDRGWDLYDEMSQGKAHAKPDAHTYATALMMLMKYPAECELAGKAPEHILKDIALSTTHRALLRDTLKTIVSADGPAEFAHAEPLFNFIVDAAGRAGIQDIASELQALKADMSVTPMDPVIPVQKETVRVENGVPMTEGHVPYNIQHMRDTLRQVLNNRSVTDLEQRQLEMERTVYDFAKQRREFEARNLKDLKINTNLGKQPLQIWMWQWYTLLKDRLADDIREIKEKELVEGKKKESQSAKAVSENVPLGPFLSCLSPDVLATLTVMEVMSLPSTSGVDGGMKTARALLDVGKAVEAEYQARILRRNGLSEKVNNGPTRTMSHHSLASLLERRAQKAAASKSEVDKRRRRPEALLEWSAPIRLKVGAFLVDHLVKIAKVEATKTENGITHTQEQEAFYHCYEHMRGMKIGVIRLNRIVAEQLEHDPVTPLVHPRQLPMLVAPRPWMDPQDGGYITGRAAVMRIRECQEQKAHLEQASQEGHLQHVFDGLNVLGSTPWVVNKDVFEVALKVWNSGE